jgi:hypothetical protein
VQNLLEHIETVVSNPVTVLTPEDFKNIVLASNDIWMVDFFAPVWQMSSLCLRLICVVVRALHDDGTTLRQGRQADEEDCQVSILCFAPTRFTLVRFGSIDCQAHQAFCAQQRVTQYPSVFLYPRNKQKNRIPFQDHPMTDQLANFVRNQLKNKVCVPCFSQPFMHASWLTSRRACTKRRLRHRRKSGFLCLERRGAVSVSAETARCS